MSNAELTPKILVAVELLDRALQMFNDGAYFAAITLAGAAEEILGVYVERAGMQSSFDNFREMAVPFANFVANEGDTTVDVKIMSNWMKYARNRTKHIHSTGDDDILFHPRHSAMDLLQRALRDYANLQTVYPLEMTELMKGFNPAAI
jgi:hypothetical protein